jgi:Aspartate/tyrosine/aromatic aminotransferase
METMTINQLLSYATDEDREKWDNLPLKYIETYGMLELRTEIANTYDNISQKNILAFAGAEEGIFAAMHCILSKDDHAIVITPNYQSSETIPNSICDVTGVSLDSDNNWDLDLQKILDAIKSNTRLIAINFPHNPTGKVISRKKLDTLIEISRKHHIYLFSDEVYRLMERREEIRLPQIADIYEKGLSLNVMSKAYGLPGLRIGWIASKDIELLDKMERMKHYLSICNSSPSEVLSVIALKSRERILERNRKIISDNLNLLSPFFEKNKDLFDWKIPDGGCISYPKISRQ